jgi:hypothetical protein
MGSGLGLVGHTLRIEQAKLGEHDADILEATEAVLDRIAEEEAEHGVSMFELAIVGEAKRRLSSCCSRACVCGGTICQTHGQQCVAGVSHD